MTRQQRLFNRNKKVRSLFAKLSDKHHQWRSDALIQKVANDMFLSKRTIEAILKYEGIYDDNNNIPKNQLNLFSTV